MAKQSLVALVLASLLVAGLALDTGRSLQAAQQSSVKYDCDGAKMISTVKNACNLLCTCAGSLNRAYATQNMKNFCIRTCNACSAAAQKCKGKGQPLPKECSAGTNIKEVNTCINTFLASQRSG